jgi:hypothetical protein
LQLKVALKVETKFFSSCNWLNWFFFSCMLGSNWHFFQLHMQPTFFQLQVGLQLIICSVASPVATKIFFSPLTSHVATEIFLFHLQDIFPSCNLDWVFLVASRVATKNIFLVASRIVTEKITTSRVTTEFFFVANHAEIVIFDVTCHVANEILIFQFTIFSVAIGYITSRVSTS